MGTMKIKIHKKEQVLYKIVGNFPSTLAEHPGTTVMRLSRLATNWLLFIMAAFLFCFLLSSQTMLIQFLHPC